MKLLSDEELGQLLPAEENAFPFPVPTQIVGSDEYLPIAQTARQREVEARMLALADEIAPAQNLDRRGFFRTAAGMAASFLAMNQVYGALFDSSRAEAATPEMADERAAALRDQFVMDVHTHFLRDDTRLTGFVAQREAVGRRGWNPALSDKPQSIEDLKFENYYKEIFLDSDTKVALISGAPSEIPEDWFLTNEMAIAARDRVNREAGSRRMLAHAIVQPRAEGWLDAVDRDIDLRPDAFKGYTIGDNTHKELARPWRLDDEALIYPFFEKAVRAGLRNICIHKGLFPPSMQRRFPNLTHFADVSDVGKAARDWPQLNFLIYHSGYRHIGGPPEVAWSEFERTGRIDWVTDLAEIPEKYGVTNVYGDLGQLFANTTVADPRLAAALLGTLIRGLGHDHVIWGTDAVWTGSPQWQIEGLRRLEIPGEMQRRHGFAPLGPADGPVKRAIFGGNSARLFDWKGDIAGDRLALRKADYVGSGPQPSHMRYGYVRRSEAG